MRHNFVTAAAAGAALAVSGATIEWLRRSSEHPDRPPLFAVAALLVAVVAGGAGLILGARAMNGVLRSTSHDTHR